MTDIVSSTYHVRVVRLFLEFQGNVLGCELDALAREQCLVRLRTEDLPESLRELEVDLRQYICVGQGFGCLLPSRSVIQLTGCWSVEAGS